MMTRTAGRTQAGTTLVIALALLAALAIIGATMISVARVDRFGAGNYKASAEVDMAADAALEYYAGLMANCYWDKVQPKPSAWNSYSYIYDWAYDSTANLAHIRPDTSGKITTKTNLVSGDGGLVRVPRGGQLKFYNYPVVSPFPDPGTASGTGSTPEGTLWSQLTVPVSQGRTIDVSLTPIDLCGRLNVNFHGNTSSTTEGINQAYADDGSSLTMVALAYKPECQASKDRTPIHSSDDVANLINGGTITGRWGADKKAELGDQTLLQQAVGPREGTSSRDLPYTLEDLYELLNTWGTPFNSRVEQLLPNSVARTGLEGGPDIKMFRRALLTTHSWVSSTRRNFYNSAKSGDSTFSYNETPGGLYVKADLNAASQDDLRAAVYATRAFDATKASERMLVDQIVANIMDYRDTDGQPTAITKTDDSGSPYTVYGVDRQPYINEVYVKLVGGAAPKQIYEVYVELANPYEKDCKKGGTDNCYSKLTIGQGAYVSDLTSGIPAAGIPAAVPWTPGAAAGVVVKTTVITDDDTGKTISKLVEPIQLYATASNGNSVLIDQMDKITLADGKSRQRVCRVGTSHAGVSGEVFFGGYTAVEVDGNQSCLDGVTARYMVNSTSTTKEVRPIENRSRTESTSGNMKRQRVNAATLSFRRTGDIARILRIGHSFDGTKITTNPTPVTAILGGAKDEASAHVDILSANKTKYRRLTEVFTVNSPYYDGIDNDGDSFIDEADTLKAFASDTTGWKARADALGPEIYEYGAINLRTAPPEVIRAMIPVQLMRHKSLLSTPNGDPLWDIAVQICEAAQKTSGVGGKKIESPADLLDVALAGSKTGEAVFDGNGWDDDSNGAPDDYAEKTFLYGYMSNWATCRSDLFAVYGTVQVTNASNQIEVVRHFVGVLDRVPATAYPPVLVDPAASATAATQPTLNEAYLPVRRLFFAWLD